MSDSTRIAEPNQPRGGTELILANLRAALPELTDQVQIVMSRPESVVLEDKPRILWLQDLPHDPASAPLKEGAYRARFNRLVFCSHWQQQQYNGYLKIPFCEGVVIRNAVPKLTPSFPKSKENSKLNFLYTSTPHRGLKIVARAAAALAKERQDWHLDVYSSLKLYGAGKADERYEPLYEELRQNPCIRYHGMVSNAEVREACLRSHVWVYPSLYSETSCMAAQEAMMAGCLAITSNLGALPETCGAWAWMFAADERAEVMVERTRMNMLLAIQNYDHPNVTTMLPLQSLYYQSFWSFEKRVPAWKQLLEEVIREGVPQAQWYIARGEPL